METIIVRTPHDLGPAVKDARLAAGRTQTEVALSALVGRTWLSQFEDGLKVSAPLDMVFRVLAELGIEVTIKAARI